MIYVICEVLWEDVELIGYCDTYEEAELIVDEHNAIKKPSGGRWSVEQIERLAHD